jgi:Type II CAAX prenyl endopeptidase Rce1-like
MMTWITFHFQRYRKLTPWAFCWRIAIEGTLVALIACIIIGFLGLGGREVKMKASGFLFLGVLLAPVWETLIFQAFPIWIARRCNARFSVQILASVVPFFIAHALKGVTTGLAAGLLTGFYLAFTYAHWREQTRWTAFWTTAGSHAIHNGIVIPLAIALGEI